MSAVKATQFVKSVIGKIHSRADPEFAGKLAFLARSKGGIRMWQNGTAENSPFYFRKRDSDRLAAYVTRPNVIAEARGLPPYGIIAAARSKKKARILHERSGSVVPPRVRANSGVKTKPQASESRSDVILFPPRVASSVEEAAQQVGLLMALRPDLDDASWEEVAKHVNEAGIRTTNGWPWTRRYLSKFSHIIVQAVFDYRESWKHAKPRIRVRAQAERKRAA